MYREMGRSCWEHEAMMVKMLVQSWKERLEKNLGGNTERIEEPEREGQDQTFFERFAAHVIRTCTGVLSISLTRSDQRDICTSSG